MKRVVSPTLRLAVGALAVVTSAVGCDSTAPPAYPGSTTGGSTGVTTGDVPATTTGPVPGATGGTTGVTTGGDMGLTTGGDMGLTTGGDMGLTTGLPDAGPGGGGMPEDLSDVPDLLSQTGLFADMASQALGPDVQAYAPQYELWSDGAGKRRWVRLPPGTQIDTTDMNAWRYPIGTKLWKEFARDGQPLETRYMAKYGPDGQDWVFMAYQWDAAMGDAVAVPDGVMDTHGTTHDIPSDLTCLKCHEGLPDAALGFSAIQLSHAAEGVTMQTLQAEGRLSVAPTGPLALPGDAVDQAALGYLHANCGHCHNPDGGEAVRKNGQIIFWQRSDQLASLDLTPTYQNLVTGTDHNLSFLTASVNRMKSRPDDAMPPVATEISDPDGIAAVDAWVQRLVQQFPQDGLPDLSSMGEDDVETRPDF